MKKLLASLLAMTMAFAFTACSLPGSDDDDESSSKKSKNSSSSSVVESDSEEDSESKADEPSSVADESSSTAEVDDSSEPEASSADDSSEAEKPAANGNFQGKGYTLNIDSAKWNDISSSVANVDCAFSYVGDTSNVNYATANFNVIAQSGANGVTPNDYMKVVKNQYETLGYKISNDEAVTFNGYDAYKIEVSMEQSGLTMDMNQIIIVDGDTLYVISFGAEASVFSTLKPEFDSVLSSFAIS